MIVNVSSKKCPIQLQSVQVKTEAEAKAKTDQHNDGV